MDSSYSLLQKQQNRTYYMWVVVFFLIISTLIGALYYSTLKIDYTWRWYRIPQYFFFNEDISVNTESDGTIAAIETIDGKTTIRITADDGEELIYTVPSIDCPLPQ